MQAISENQGSFKGASDSGTYAQVDALLMKLKRRQLSSKDVAIETATALRKVISGTKGNNPKKLLEEVRAVGRKLAQASPAELTVGNIVRRVLFIIREEHANASQAASKEGEGRAEEGGGHVTRHAPSLGNVLEGDLSLSLSQNWTEEVPTNFKQLVSAEIMELINEIEAIKEQVADQAMEHVHSNEVILTCGFSKTTLHFLKEVSSRGRRFEVVVSENAPSLEGHDMAKELAKAGISTTVISDAAVFAIMARVNKVIVGCYAVLANGGITGLTGMHTVAMAAKHHNVPFVVCTGMYKLSPVFPHDQYSFNELKSPAEVSGGGQDAISRSVRVLNPSSDYVPPELVGLFITNAGGHNPSYIYRLLAEYYSLEDRVL
mmetsp:Transcript_53155/g.108416  ORF Transcript_53155/g.108416 Transcript_53155/m.108416 type:complete len:376 (+) Transcript_53155:111-1238(+)